MLHRIYIDESGDRGRKPGSSNHFVASAVVIRDHEDAKVRSELASSKSAMNLGTSTTLHFRKLSHPRRVKICQDIARYSIACVTNVIICKHKLTPFPIVTFAHLKRFKASKLHEHREALYQSPTRIHWKAFHW